MRSPAPHVITSGGRSYATYFIDHRHTIGSGRSGLALAETPSAGPATRRYCDRATRLYILLSHYHDDTGQPRAIADCDVLPAMT